MKAVDLFYVLKPLIPRKMQLAIRRQRALLIRQRNSAKWPIDPLAARVPNNWPGWPEGKKFAIVLFHDVDTAKGLKNCMKLLELEKSLGFVSSFNFVPLGYYLPDTTRQKITESGFEVGVHGLTHEGRAFKNYRSFSQLVPRINEFLKEWQSLGYTSPAMLGNLRWIADLNIAYGCSSFDTDPFEPRPYGVGTIFPFVVPALAENNSYVELPYTLPQDHSLFVLLKERDISIWKRKLDWIAEIGGMVMLNTHPDYMNFSGTKCSLEEYPANHYASLLEYVKSRYKDQYWNALPMDLAHFWKTKYPKDATYDYDGTSISASNRVASYSHGNKISRKVKLALVCSSGGHFEQMQNLYQFYQGYPRFWIANRTAQTEYSLSEESRRFISGAHFKKPWTYVAQFPHVYKILKREQPTHIISTGSGMIGFIPFFLSRLLNIKFIHIETFSHVHHLTKMGKLIRIFRHPILSQWDGLKLKNVQSIGPAISNSLPVAQESISEDLVFVTLGMRVHAFPRIVEAVESLIREGFIEGKVVIQLGFTKYQSKLAEMFDFCTPADINRFISSSKYIITQESAGIVTKCLRLRKKFIVMPRDYKFRELPTKSDMNEDLHYKLAELGYTYVVHNKEQLEEAIKNIDRLKTGFNFDNTRAIATLKEMVESE